MPLKLTLKPNEKILIGSAVIANGPSKTEIAIMNRVPVVREKDMLALEDAQTPVEKLYASLVEMYVDPTHEKEAYKLYRLLLEQLLQMHPDPEVIDLLSEISAYLKSADHYKAMRTCKKLMELETAMRTGAPQDSA